METQFFSLEEIFGGDLPDNKSGQEEKEPSVKDVDVNKQDVVDDEVTKNPEDNQGVQVDDKQVVEETEPVEANEEPTPQEPVEVDNEYYKKISDLISIGVLPEVEGIEDEEGNVIPLHEVDWDEDTFKEFVNSAISDKIEEEKKKELDSLSPIAKKLVEVDRQGGDISKLLDTYTNVVEPYLSLNLDDEQNQVYLVKSVYGATGLSEDEINVLISKYKESGDLRAKAEEARKRIEERYEQMVEQEKQLAEQRKKEEEKRYKEFSEKAKKAVEKLPVSDGVKKEVVNIVTNKKIDDIFESVKKDPEKIADLIAFALDKEKYLQDYGLKASKNAIKKVYKRIKIAPKSGGTKKPSTPVKGKAKNEFDLNEL